MKKRIFAFLLMCSFCVSILGLQVFAVYDDGPRNSEYSRTDAQEYIEMYTTDPNDDEYYYFSSSGGGDCTSFVSQVVHAGGMEMTPAKSNPGTDSWYYYGPNWGRGRSSSWAGAGSFREYWADINGKGEKNAYQFITYSASELRNDNVWYDVWSYLEPGDIVQYVRTNDWATYHSQAVYETTYERGEYVVTVGQHTSDGWRNLRDYIASLDDRDTIVCLIKISANSGRYSKGLNDLRALSFDELVDKSEHIATMTPESIDDEHTKWAEISAVKNEMILRAKTADYTYQKTVTWDALEQFVYNRVESNELLIAQLRAYGDNDRETQRLIANAEAENNFINTFWESVDSSKNVDEYWNEYWNTVVQQSPPSYYISEACL